jgi:hypothetical protein
MNLRAAHSGHYTVRPSERGKLNPAVLLDWLWNFYPLLTIALKLRGKISLKMTVNQSWWPIRAKIHHAWAQNRLILRWLKPQWVYSHGLSKPLSGFT